MTTIREQIEEYVWITDDGKIAYESVLDRYGIRVHLLLDCVADWADDEGIPWQQVLEDYDAVAGTEISQQ